MEETLYPTHPSTDQDEPLNVHRAVIPSPKSSILSKLLPSHTLNLNNPILLYELIARLRKKTSFLFLITLLVPVTLAFLFFWEGYVQSTQPAEIQSRLFFLNFNYIEGVLLLLLIPLLCATSVNTEYEKETWDLLFTTPLSLANILIGKFLSSILFIILLILSLVPIYGLSMIIGGISPAEIIVMLLLLGEIIVIVGLIGLFFSILCKRSWIAVFLSYIAIGLYSVIFIFPNGIFGSTSVFSPLVTAWIYFTNQPLAGSLPGASQKIFYFSHLGCTTVVISILAYFCYLGLKRVLKKKDQLTFLAEMGEALHKELQKIRPLLTLKFVRKDYLPDEKNPVRIKETWDLFGRQATFLLVWLIVLLFSGGYILTQHTFFIIDKRIVYRLFFWKDLLGNWPMLLIPFFVLPFAANCIRHEFTRNTWELLSATLMTPWQIVRGKFCTGLHVFQLQFWAFFICILAAGLFSYWNTHKENPFSLELFMGTIWISYVSSVLYLSIGMICSAYFRALLSAYALSFSLVLLVLFGGILRLGNHPWLVSLLSPYFLIQLYGGVQNRFTGLVWWKILLGQTLWMLLLSWVLCFFTVHKCRRSDSRNA